MRRAAKTLSVCFVTLLAACDRGAAPAQARPVEASPPMVPTSQPGASAPVAPVQVASVAQGAALPTSPPPNVPPVTYVRYGNPRFGFSVDVPAFFHAESPPANGDGQTWIWGDAATMTAWGMNNAGLTTDVLCRETLHARRG
jgi:hypothetical protein